MKPLPTIERLRECFDYDPETGILTWKVRPRGHFKDDRSRNSWNARYAGRAVGTLDEQGYILTNLSGKFIRAHRLIWALVTGGWPPAQIDHKDGVKSNNRLSNLREATKQMNCCNIKWASRCKSGIKGVVWVRKARKWRVSVQALGRRHHIGEFNHVAEAELAARAARERLHGEFANHG